MGLSFKNNMHLWCQCHKVKKNVGGFEKVNDAMRKEKLEQNF